MNRKKILTLEAANQIVLANLNLLQRADIDQLPTIPRATVGLHSARFPSPFFSIAARVNIKSFDSVINEIYMSPDYIRQRGLRGTIFIHCKEDAPYFHKATLKKRNQACKYMLKHYGITIKLHQEASEYILELLRYSPMEYGNLITEAQTQLNKKRSCIGELPKMALRSLWENGIVIRLNQSREWKKEKKVFALNENIEWKRLVNSISEEYAKEIIIKRYFTNYGPATIGDAAWWSEIAPSSIRQILKRNREEFAEVYIRGNHTPFYTHISNLYSGKVCTKGRCMVKLLAYEDNLLKGYKESRLRFTEAQYNSLVYNASGEANATILVDGSVKGTWRLQNSRIEAKPFKSFPKKYFTSLAKELDRLSEITGYENVIHSGGNSRI